MPDVDSSARSHSQRPFPMALDEFLASSASQLTPHGGRSAELEARVTRGQSAWLQRSSSKFDEKLSNCALSLNLRPYSTACAWPARSSRSASSWQGGH